MYQLQEILLVESVKSINFAPFTKRVLSFRKFEFYTNSIFKFFLSTPRAFPGEWNLNSSTLKQATKFRCKGFIMIKWRLFTTVSFRSEGSWPSISSEYCLSGGRCVMSLPVCWIMRESTQPRWRNSDIFCSIFSIFWNGFSVSCWEVMHIATFHLSVKPTGTTSIPDISPPAASGLCGDMRDFSLCFHNGIRGLLRIRITWRLVRNKGECKAFFYWWEISDWHYLWFWPFPHRCSLSAKMSKYQAKS